MVRLTARCLIDVGRSQMLNALFLNNEKLSAHKYYNIKEKERGYYGTKNGNNHFKKCGHNF